MGMVSCRLASHLEVMGLVFSMEAWAISWKDVAVCFHLRQGQLGVKLALTVLKETHPLSGKGCTISRPHLATDAEREN
jgi:hypothetical protein